MSNRQLTRLYMENLDVRVTAIGYNRVWSDWREIDYTPDFNKFYLICDGEGWIKIGDSEFHPKPGQLFLMPHGVKQSYSYTSGPRYTKYWCHFTARVGERNLFDLLQTPLFIDTTNDSEAVQLFGELLNGDSAASISGPLLIKSAMLRLISYYLEHAVTSMEGLRPSLVSEPLQQVISYIQGNYHRNLTIEELAEQAHLHPNYFIRVFKRQFGTSPIQYINKKRLEEAKLLLVTTNLLLSEIGETVGIPDISYLSRLFKVSTGFSPTAYRMTFRSHQTLR
ncbi:AraC family transcriptional regulator [Bacillus sp. 3255]|uniref:AraC family transcriptional regulator n=1 Tax=Bacillus sp. 3255 TaxID=2817904 RepID=UPI00285B159C|nr:AraC family transcriptional regulator [Bacillus sp. 3255]MDR6881364.1 AraC-like DNA-binding protein [Bacillus sp. 3255]